MDCSLSSYQTAENLQRFQSFLFVWKGKTESIKYAICLKIQLSLGRNSAWRAFCRLGLMINCVSTFLIAGCPIWNTSTKYYNYKTINNIIKHELELEKKNASWEFKRKNRHLWSTEKWNFKKVFTNFLRKKAHTLCGLWKVFQETLSNPMTEESSRTG